ncbi:MAG: hypothetical protein ACOH2R_17520 [Pseudomonas sp.]
MNSALNFEKTRKTAPRRNADEMEVVRARKGKHNKADRTQRQEWEAL